MGIARLSRLWLLLVLAALLITAPAAAAASARYRASTAQRADTTDQTSSVIDVQVDPSGHWTVQTHAPDMTFAGDIGQAVTNIRTADAQDGVGAYHEVDFDYGSRSSGIRAYPQSGAAVFTTTYVNGGANADAFPKFTTLPQLPYKLSYHDTPFSPYQINTVADAPDSPWLFFDGSDNGFLISPASDFPVARMVLGADGSLSSGIDAGVPALPVGFSHATLLVVSNGLNRLFETWGNTLTTLHNKVRPANDADLTLNKFGYWTDNGATYYYHFEPQLGYEGTLLNVLSEFAQRGLAVGYLQLDSWWYPKGPNARWDDTAGGIFQYRAAPDLFPDGLSAFHAQEGLPLVTHARWIDPSSPYRSTFASSGNVMTDPGYWSDLMTYLHDGGVVTYEQDWLGAQAQPVYDLSAPQAFMGDMAAAATQQGLTLQYCMPLPRHVLQTVEYANVTSMRVSDDRFDRNRWDTFLYTSRLANALGVWPWSDVFMSTERDNLLLSDLSGGIVGIGDALGAENADNLRHVMRSDAVLVKPDAALAPTDQSIIAEASQGSQSPMVASTFTDHDGMRALYVFAYARNGGTESVSVSPASLGLSGSAYAFDYFNGDGQLVDAGGSFTKTVSDGTYVVVAPVGPSGIAFLGDSGEFAPLGRKRISHLSDDGSVKATVEFASGEQAVTLFGYAPTPPSASATSGGSTDEVVYDATTHRFTVSVHPQTTPSSVNIELSE